MEGRHLVLLFLLMTGKFYTLGIMRSLNSRPGLRGRMTSDDIGRTSISDWQWDDEQGHPGARRSSEVSSLCVSDVHVISRLKQMCRSGARCHVDAVP
jgi:hypothetical protein